MQSNQARVTTAALCSRGVLPARGHECVEVSADGCEVVVLRESATAGTASPTECKMSGGKSGGKTGGWWRPPRVALSRKGNDLVELNGIEPSAS